MSAIQVSTPFNRPLTIKYWWEESHAKLKSLAESNRIISAAKICSMGRHFMEQCTVMVNCLQVGLYNLCIHTFTCTGILKQWLILSTVALYCRANLLEFFTMFSTQTCLTKVRYLIKRLSIFYTENNLFVKKSFVDSLLLTSEQQWRNCQLRKLNVIYTNLFSDRLVNQIVSTC